MKYKKLLWDLYRLKGNYKRARKQIQDLQEKKLRKMLRYAYENSAYYHNAFAKAGIAEDNSHTLPLSAFPTIDKSALLEHFDDLIIRSGRVGKRRRHASYF